jgi:hypothetical protein
MEMSERVTTLCGRLLPMFWRNKLSPSPLSLFCPDNGGSTSLESTRLHEIIAHAVSKQSLSVLHHRTEAQIILSSSRHRQILFSAWDRKPIYHTGDLILHKAAYWRGDVPSNMFHTRHSSFHSHAYENLKYLKVQSMTWPHFDNCFSS